MRAWCAHGTTSSLSFVRRLLKLLVGSMPECGAMPERSVRFTQQFFDRLDDLFPDERGADGSPSATDFLLYELPRIRDLLAADFERNTLPADEPPVRLYIGSGTLVGYIALYAVVADDGAVEVIWLLVG